MTQSKPNKAKSTLGASSIDKIARERLMKIVKTHRRRGAPKEVNRLLQLARRKLRASASTGSASKKQASAVKEMNLCLLMQKMMAAWPPTLPSLESAKARTGILAREAVAQSREFQTKEPVTTTGDFKVENVKMQTKILTTEKDQSKNGKIQ